LKAPASRRGFSATKAFATTSPADLSSGFAPRDFDQAMKEGKVKISTWNFHGSNSARAGFLHPAAVPAHACVFRFMEKACASRATGAIHGGSTGACENLPMRFSSRFPLV
jgi:hypothetical protein